MLLGETNDALLSIDCNVIGSEFEKLFGETCRGRPPLDASPVGAPSGNPVITEKARRRAMRVLRSRHADEFESLMESEANWLRTKQSSP